MATSELEELGESTDDLAGGFSKYRDELIARTGVDIQDAAGNYRDLFEIFVDIAKVWNQMADDQSKARVGEILGGTRNQAGIMSTIQNIADAIGAYEGALDSAGTAMRANELYMQSTEAHIGQLKAAFQELSTDVFNSDFLKGGVDTIKSIVEAIDSLAKSVGTLGTVAIGGGLAKFLLSLLQVKKATGSFKVLSALGKTIPGLAAGMEAFTAAIANGSGAFAALAAGAGSFLAVAWPLLAVLGAIAAAVAGFKYFDKVNTEWTRANEKAKESADSYKEAKQELESYQQQQKEGFDKANEIAQKYNVDTSGLETVDQVIDKIHSSGKGITLVDEAELSKISAANEKVESQIKLQEQLVKAREQASMADARAAATTEKSYWEELKDKHGGGVFGTIGAGFEYITTNHARRDATGKPIGESAGDKWRNRDTTTYGLAKTALDEYIKTKNELAKVSESESGDVEKRKAKYDELTQTLGEQGSELSEYMNSLSDTVEILSSSTNPADQTIVKQYKDLIEQFTDIDLTDEEKALNHLNNFFDGSAGKNAIKEKLAEAAKKGQDLETVLKRLGLSLDDLGADKNSLEQYFAKAKDGADKAAEAVKNYHKTVSDVEEAGKSANQDKDWTTIQGAIKQANEDLEAGKTGTDDFQTIAQFLSPKNLQKLAEDAKKKGTYVADVYQEAFEKAQKKAERYFGEDEGKSLFENFASDLEKKGFFKIDKNDEKGLWDIQLQKKFKNTAQAADELGISVEAVETLLEAMGTYGYDFSKIEKSGDMLNEYTTTLNNLKGVYDSMEDGKAKEALGESIKNYETQLKQFDGDLSELTKPKVIEIKFEYDIAQVRKDVENLEKLTKAGGGTTENQAELIVAKGNLIEKTMKQSGLDKKGVELPVQFTFAKNKVDQLMDELQHTTDGEKKLELQAQITDYQEMQQQIIDQFAEAHPKITPETDVKKINEALASQKFSINVGFKFDKTGSKEAEEATGGDQEKETKVVASVEGLNKVEEMKDSIEDVPTDSEHNKPSIVASVIGKSLVDNLVSSINALHSKTITVETHYKTTGHKTTGVQELHGTAHASGTAWLEGLNKSYLDYPIDASYYPSRWQTPKGQHALTGEVGPEMVVNGNQWWLVGQNGAEFTHIPAHSVVFNSRQTEELLSSGMTDSRGSFLGGSAFAKGSKKESAATIKKKYKNILKKKKARKKKMMGNVDLNHRPIVLLDNGAYHTLYTASFLYEWFKKDGLDIKPIHKGDKAFNATPIYPSGRMLESSDALYDKIYDYIKAGGSLNKFPLYMGSYKSLKAAEKAAMSTHNSQAKMYDKEAKYKRLYENLKKKSKLLGSAFAHGSLTGELGPEMIVHDNKWWLTGQGGAEFSKIPPNSLVFDNKQTEELLKNGSIDSRAHFGGTAFRYGTKKKEESSGSSSSGSGKSRGKSNKTKKKKSGKTNIEKYIDKLFDWIEIALQRVSDRIDTYVNRAKWAKEDKNYSASTSNYQKAISSSASQLRKEKTAETKYTKQADKILNKAVKSGNITKKQAKTIKKNDKNGKLKISSYGKKMQTILKEFQSWMDKARKAKQDSEEIKRSIQEYVEEIYDNIKSAFDDLDEKTNKIMELNKARSGNATSAASKNAYLKNVAAGYDQIVANDNSEIAQYDSAINSNASTISKYKVGTKKYKNAKKATKKKVDQVIAKAKNEAKGGKKISDATMKSVADYYAKGYIGEKFYTACLSYNEAIDKKEEATVQRDLDVETAKAEKAALGQEMFSNVKEEYSNRERSNSTARALTEARQATKTTRGQALTANDYQELKDSTAREKAIYEQEQAALRKIVQENLVSGYWTTGSQEYLDAINDIEDLSTKIQECVTQQEEYNNAIAQLPLDRIQKQLEILDAIASLIEAQQNIKTTKGYLLDEADYTASIAENLKQMAEYEKLRADYLAYAENASKSSDGYWGGKSAGEWNAEANKTAATIANLAASNEELKNSIVNIPFEKLEKQLEYLESAADYYDSLRELRKSRGEEWSEMDYLDRIADVTQKIALYEQQREHAYTNYLAAMAAGENIGGKSAEEWLSDYYEFSTTINESKSTIEEIKDDLRDDVYWRTFEKAHDSAKRLLDVVQGIADLTSDDMYFDKDGNLTQYGIAQVANLVKQYELARTEVQNYTNDIKNLNELYSQGQYTMDEYNEKLAELQSGVLDAANTMKTQIEAIKDMYKEMAQSELDALMDLIDAREKSLSAKKSYYEYGKSMRDHQQEINDLQSEIAALSGVEGAAAAAKKAKLEESLAKAQEELEDMQMDHYFELSQDALSELKETLQEQFDDKWERLGQNLKAMAQLLSDANTLAKDNASNISTTLNEILDFYGINNNTTGIGASYASGTRRVGRSLIGLSNESGSELIITPNGIISHFNPGDGVVPSDLTARLYTLAESVKPNSSIGNSSLKGIKYGAAGDVNQYYDSLIHIDGSADAATVEDLKRMSKNILETSYEYTSRRINQDYVRTGGLRRI